MSTQVNITPASQVTTVEVNNRELTVSVQNSIKTVEVAVEARSNINIDISRSMAITGVQKIIAGSGVTIDPPSGQGNVTISSTGVANNANYANYAGNLIVSGNENNVHVNLGNTYIDSLARLGNAYTQIYHNQYNWQVYPEDDTTGPNPAWAWLNLELSNINNPVVIIETQPADTGIPHTWTFDAQGNLTLPGDASKPSAIVFDAEQNVSIQQGMGTLSIGVNNDYWSFGSDSNTAFPATGTANLGNLAVANFFSGDGSLLSNLTIGNIDNANYANYAGNAFAVDVANVIGIGNIATINLDGNASNLLDGTGAWVPIPESANSNYANFAGTAFNVAGANVSGEVASANYATYAGTAYSVDAGNINGAVANANYANLAYVSTFASEANSVAGANVTGNVGNALNAYAVDGANVSLIGNPNELLYYKNGNIGVSPYMYVDGNGLYVEGNIQLGGAGHFKGDGSYLSNIQGGNISGEVANANYSSYSGNTYSVDVANVVGIGNIATVNLDGNSGNILYGNGVFSAVPDVANANTANYANYANFAGEAYSVSGANVVGEVANANYATYAGTVTTNAQPNITSVGILTDLSVTGNISTDNNVTALKFYAGVGGDEYHGYGFTGANNSNTAMCLTNDDEITIYNNAVETLTLYANNNSKFYSNLAIDGHTDLGNVSNVKITGGTNGYVLQTDGVGNLTWTAQTGGGGNGTVAGSNTQVQFNNAGNFGATAGFTFDNTSNIFTAPYLAGDGNGLSNIAGANVSGQVGNALVAGTVYTNAQPNITSVGTLTSLDITGNISSGNANLGNLTTSNYFSGNGSLLTGITSTTGNANYANFAGTAYSVSGANVSGEVANANYATYAGTAYSVSGANVSGQVGNALVAGTVYTNAQPNITSVGTLSSLSVTGNISSGNASLGNLVTANFFSGNGSLLTDITSTTGNANYANYAGTAYSVSGSNVSGQVGNALIAGTVYTNAQPNITSVGTLTDLTVSGNISSGNATLGNLAIANYFSGDGSLLTGITATTGNANYANYAGNAFSVSGSNVSGAVNLANFATTANAVAGANVSGAVAYATTANSVAGANVSGAVAFATTANAVAGANVSGTVANATHAISSDSANSVAGANVSGQVGNALIAGTVYTNAQPNITSVGTLTNLFVTGDIQGYANVSADYILGNGAFLTGVGDFSAALGYHGSFFSNVSQTIASTTTAYPITLNNTSAGTYGVFVASNSRVTFTYAGTYNIQYSVQFTSTDSGIHNASIWLRKNGVDVPDTNSIYAIPAKHGGTINGQLIAAINYIQDVGANDYYELIWQAESTNISLEYIPPGTTPTSPAAPSAIVTAMQVTNVQAATLSGNLTGNLVGNSYGLTGVSFVNVTGNLTGNVIIGNGSGLTQLVGANVTGTVANATYAITAGSADSVAGANVSGAVNLATYATTANAVAGANVSGTVANATYAITAGSADSVAGANVSGAVNLATYATTANAVAGANVSGTVANATYSVTAGTAYSVSAGNITGTINLANYATTANSVAGSNVSGAVNLATYATTANAVAGANVSGNVGNALNAYAVAVANVTGIGNIATINLDGSNSSVLYGNGVFATISIPSGTTISNGTSNVNIATSGGNVTIGVAGNANIVTVTGTGVNIAGYANIGTGNLTAGNANLGNAVTSNYFIGNLYGTANLATYATTANAVAGANVSGNVGNALNAYAVDGANVSGNVGNALNAYAVDGANVSGNVGNALNAYAVAVANVTGIGNIATTNYNGNGSQVLAGNGAWVAQSGGGGTPGGSNTFVQFNDGSSFGGNSQFTYNKATNVLTVGNITANGAGLSSIAGANVSGQVGNALIAGTVYTNAQPNITSLGNLTSVTTIGNINVQLANGAGSNGLIYMQQANVLWLQSSGFTRLSMDGNGGASFDAKTYVLIQTNTPGPTYQWQFNASGNTLFPSIGTANLGNLALSNNLTITGVSNLNSVSNVIITGGSNNYVLSTNGSGNLSWVAQSGGGSSATDFTPSLLLGGM